MADRGYAIRHLDFAYFDSIGGTHPQPHPQELFVRVVLASFFSSGLSFCSLASFVIVVTSLLFKCMRIYLNT